MNIKYFLIEIESQDYQRRLVPSHALAMQFPAELQSWELF